MDYQAFLASKRLVFQNKGIEVADSEINQTLFPFQKDLTRWALRKGRAAIFADTGLGKTLIQLEWGKAIPGRCIIVAPLSVAKQTIREAMDKLGLTVNYCRSNADVKDGLNITNYEMIENLDPALFSSIVLDESSILKSLSGKIREKLTRLYRETPYRLCCTATPAPNDIAEIANHAEFLGVMSRTDMLATFFVHDADGWRLKGHAKDHFFRWLASWGMSLSLPSDIGYSDDGYILPPLSVTPVMVSTNYRPDGQLFASSMDGLKGQARARKQTITEKVDKVADLINGKDGQWIVWCGLNDEGGQLHRAIPDSVLIEGQDSTEAKETAIEKFQNGTHRVLVSKTKITGFGMNFQNCHQMVFCGLSYSWESYYQAIRRCYRFGQTNQVNVFVVLSELETGVYQAIREKEREAEKLKEGLVRHVTQYERAEIAETVARIDYTPDANMVLPTWLERRAA